MTAGPVLAVAGLAREARIAAGDGVETIQAGGRPAVLRQRLAAIEAPAYRAVVSFGIAGGLDPALRPGDVVVGTRVTLDQAEAGPFACDPSLVGSLARRLAGLSSRVLTAGLAAADVAVLSQDAKAALRARTGAAAVDMESHVAAAFAARHALPFAAIRVVCDPAERALPAFAAAALTPEGEPDLRAVLAALFTGKARLPELVRLARDSSAAFGSLARARTRLGDGLGL